jgi:serine/threonine-protein kinase PpkA
MVKARCDKFGLCPLADGSAHEVASLHDHPCTLRDETGECGLRAANERGLGGGSQLPEWLKPAAIALAAILIVAAAVWFLIPRGARCDIPAVREMMQLDPKAGELERTGIACLAAGNRDGDSDALVLATQALRLASDKGSAAAALAMGRLFDPLARPELETDAKNPMLLPAPDAAIALGYYDKAAGTEAQAREAAAALRAKYPALAREATNADGRPLSMPGHDGLFQRVLVKPGATLVNAPGATDGVALQTFDILYVFGAKPGWRQVGRAIETGAEGWVAEGSVQSWNVMLAMRYAPQGARNPVLFFRDELSVKGLLLGPDPAGTVTELVQAIADGKDDPRLLAIEDQSVDWRTRPYVMPILRTVPFNSADGRVIQLAEIGSVAGLGGVAPAGGPAARCPAQSARQLVHQVVFVIDTTASMGPYIEGVHRIANVWRDEIARRNIGQKFRFGAVAYRNNMDAEPQRSALEYVTAPILPLSAGSDAAALADSVGKLAPAAVSTHSFDEDAVAGLDEALGFDWSQGCGVKMIFLITDAGALPADDVKSRHPGTGLATIAARARDLGIDVFPVHVQTREARAAANVEHAANQYRSELDTGAANGEPLYRVIPNGSPASFGDYLGQVGAIIAAADDEARNKLQTKPELANTADQPQAVKDIVLGRMFSVQQRFLGSLAGAAAPTFASSWTSDRDLGNLDLTALEVSVYLSRRQLNQLAERTNSLIANATRGKTESGSFFNLLRMVSAATAQDPKRAGTETNLGALMPSFLSVLPYKSEVVALTPEDWRAMGASKQDSFIGRLRQKLAYYRKLDADQSQWLTLAGNDSAEAIALVPLRQLP